MEFKGFEGGLFGLLSLAEGILISLDSALSPQTGGGALNPLRDRVYKQDGVYIPRVGREVEFWKMKPMDEGVLKGTAFALGEVGKSYVIYLPYGGRIQLRLNSSGLFSYRWFDPREGMFKGEGMFNGDRAHYFTSLSEGDWVQLIEKAR